MGVLLPIILTALPGLINAVETAFAKPKSGTDKMNAVVQALQAILSTLSASGQFPASTVPATEPLALQGITETVLSQMKGNGTLAKPGATTPVATAQLYLVHGTVSLLQTV